jgi:hypothetical protein
MKSVVEIRDREKILNGIIKRCVETEKLPLPLFAIHQLRRANPRGPAAMLECAIQSRDNADVKAVRAYLNRWERASATNDLDDQNGVVQELAAVERHIRSRTGLDDPKSVLPISLQAIVDLLTGRSSSKSIAALLEHFIDLRSVQSRKRVRTFLSLVASDLGSERSLGAWMMKAMNREFA